MVEYTCDRCGFSCIYKNNFRKHITRKHPCKAKLKDIPVEYIQQKYNILPNKIEKQTENKIIKSINNDSIVATEIKCKKCNKTFSKQRYLSKHTQNCSGSNQELIIKKLEEENKMLKNTRIIHQTTNIINNTTNNTSNITNNNNNTYILNNYGSENWDYMDTKKLQNFLIPPIPAITQVNKHIYCNKEHPENHNMKISSLYGNYIQVFENDEWVHKLKNEVLENIVDKTYGKLDNCYEEVNKDFLTKSQNKRFKNFQKEFETNEKFKKDICEKTGIMIYNFSRKKEEEDDNIELIE
tara:strand:+ start:664 stop:1551 length:888 start_codon:yes stop_codon:yes gene_type:complete